VSSNHNHIGGRTNDLYPHDFVVVVHGDPRRIASDAIALPLVGKRAAGWSSIVSPKLDCLESNRVCQLRYPLHPLLFAVGIHKRRLLKGVLDVSWNMFAVSGTQLYRVIIDSMTEPYSEIHS
jgi:hypothetical protein